MPHPYSPAWSAELNIAAFKQTDQEIIEFYARTALTTIPGVPKLDPSRVIDGQRLMVFYKQLPPTSAGKDFVIRSKVLGVYDKGKSGSVLETEQLLVERKTGDIYTKCIGSAFFFGQGNWGGPKGEWLRWANCSHLVDSCSGTV